MEILRTGTKDGRNSIHKAATVSIGMLGTFVAYLAPTTDYLIHATVYDYGNEKRCNFRQIQST